MVKLGIISDTHFEVSENKEKMERLLTELKRVFKDVDEIIHAGDVCNELFLQKLNDIAPTRCVKGNMDNIDGLKDFITFSIGKYNIGVIHKLPDDLENFYKAHNLHVLIYGHSHAPVIQGTPFNTLIINPGSPTLPKAPPKRPFFKEPVARPSVITLEIDDNDMIKTFIINLKI